MSVAIITGGSRGLGKSVALHLAEKGVDSIITYRSQESEAHAVVQAIEAKGARARALRLDASDTGSFETFARELKCALHDTWKRPDFDFLVNNAGTGLSKPFMETTEDEFDTLYKVHLKGVYFLTQRLAPLIKEGGRIINISSGLARFSFAGSSAYAAMKGGVEVLSRYMAVELGARGISVNTVAPGAIATDFNGGHVRDNPQLNKALSEQTSLGRVGLPDDIGGMVASLLSQDNAWINGQRIEVSGGFRL